MMEKQVTRKEQINNAREQHPRMGDISYLEDQDLYRCAFRDGAEWADANPLEFIGDLITQRSIAFDYGRHQAAMLKVAIEALEEISSTYGTTTQKGFENKIDLKIADEALKKIEQMKKEFDDGNQS
jgi:hypothetical protein